MEITLIQQYFCIMTNMMEDEAVQYQPIMEAAGNYIDLLCGRKQLDTEQDVKAVHYAAAARAFRDYTALCVSLEPSFEAGDLKVTQYNGRLDAAERLYQEALQGISHLVVSDSWMLERVVS